MKIYFVCMKNYYRSRLAEELAIHYAQQAGLKIEVDSGGLQEDVEHSSNLGPIATEALRYLEAKKISPVRASRYPKCCEASDVYSSNIVVCTDADEQLQFFKQRFPDYTGKIIAWRARDQYGDPLLQTPFLIDKNMQELMKQLNNDT